LCRDKDFTETQKEKETMEFKKFFQNEALNKDAPSIGVPVSQSVKATI
jgi:hypothetical protein